MSRIWVKVIRKHRIERDEAAPCAWGDEHRVLEEVCHRLDLPVPMWLNKHVGEFERFRRTAFLREHFIEEIRFDKLEVEFLEDEEARRKSRDPRNEF